MFAFLCYCVTSVNGISPLKTPDLHSNTNKLRQELSCSVRQNYWFHLWSLAGLERAIFGQYNSSSQMENVVWKQSKPVKILLSTAIQYLDSAHLSLNWGCVDHDLLKLKHLLFISISFKPASNNQNYPFQLKSGIYYALSCCILQMNPILPISLWLKTDHWQGTGSADIDFISQFHPQRRWRVRYVSVSVS